MQFFSFSWMDYAILLIIGLSIMIGLVRGFIREALSLATWVLAVWVGITFCTEASQYLKPYISHHLIRMGATFFILFAGVLITGSLISFLLTQLAHKTGLSGTDRVLGIVFGLTRGVLVVAVALLAIRMTGMSRIGGDSVLAPQFKPMVAWFIDLMPKNEGLDDQMLVLQQTE